MYKLATPDAVLLPFIEHYWAVTANPGETVDLSVDVFVDARADLVFNFGAPYSRSAIGRRPVGYEVSNLDAQRDVPIRIVQRGDVAIFGARFRTGGLAPFVRAALSRYTNRTPGVEEVFGAEARSLESSLSDGRSDIDGQAKLLDRFLLDRLAIDPAYALFSEVKTEVETSGGRKTIEALSRGAAISPRNLDRLFQRLLGFSPKSFARIIRFQKALRILMEDAASTLAEVSAECGYFDQSHFVKDFRRFTGGVPHGYKGYYPPAVPRDFAPNVVRFLQDDEKAQPHL
jgi:AraC-like DNA-binding protein